MRGAKFAKRYLPSSVIDIARPLAYKYWSLQADRSHQTFDMDIEPKEGAPNHILLIVVDALRPDATPKMGLDSPITTAVTPSTWTYPSVTSLHTGKYPHEHGAVVHTYPEDTHLKIPEQYEDNPTLPQILGACGYDTYAGCSFLTPFLAIRDWYQTHSVKDDAHAETVISDYQQWRSGRSQTFSYLHLGDLHAPINPPKEYISDDIDMDLPNIRWIREYTEDYDVSDDECQYYRENKMRLYEAALDYVSKELKKLVDRISDDTFIIITGDHGEAFWEQVDVDKRINTSWPTKGVGHGGTPLDKVARVPLTIQSPKRDISIEGGWPSLCDIPRTVTSEIFDESPFSKSAITSSIPEDRIVLCEGCRYGDERKAAYSRDNKVVYCPENEILLTARIDGYGEEYTDIDDEVVERLVSALPVEDPTSGDTAGALIKEQLSALGYK